MNLHSKIAIVSGASSGLGASISQALVAKGAQVYGLARNLEALEKLKQNLGEEFIPVTMDISDREKLEKWVKQTFSDNHAPDILINNAGAGYFGKVDDLPLEKWDKMVNTNLNGLFYLTSQIVPFMKQKNTSSHILNIGSILGKMSGAEKSGYSATKFAIQGFSEALFKELRTDNIKVSCINPGSIDTSFFADSGVKPTEKMLRPEDIADILIHVLETPENVLINELTVRPLNLK